MHQPENSGNYKNYHEQLDKILNEQYFTVDLSSMKDLNDMLKEMLFGPNVDDTLYKQLNNFTDAIFATYGSDIPLPATNGVIHVGKNSYGEAIYKPNHFVVNELKTEYFNHIRQHGAWLLSQPEYYRGLQIILN